MAHTRLFGQPEKTRFDPAASRAEIGPTHPMTNQKPTGENPHDSTTDERPTPKNELVLVRGLSTPDAHGSVTYSGIQFTEDQ